MWSWKILDAARETFSKVADIWSLQEKTFDFHLLLNLELKLGYMDLDGRAVIFLQFCVTWEK